LKKYGKNMVPNLWNWLVDNNYTYDGTTSHVYWKSFRPYTSNYEFRISKFIAEGDGDCEDTAALYDISNNALGVLMRTRVIKHKRKHVNFVTNNIRAYNETNPFENPNIEYWSHTFNVHMVACNKRGTKIWDPTLKFESLPNFAICMNKNDYRNKLIVPKDLNNVEWIKVVKCDIIK